MSGNPYPLAERTTRETSQAAPPVVPRTPSLPPVRQGFRRAVGASPLVSHVELGPLDSAVPTARLRAQVVMQEWGFGEDFIYTAGLLVTELVTNALHASQALTLPMPSPIHLWIKAGFQRVTIMVWDGNPQPPVLNEAVPDDVENGRGLMLVDFFAEEWGWFEPQRIGGKCVWCEVVQQPDEQE